MKWCLSKRARQACLLSTMHSHWNNSKREKSIFSALINKTVGCRSPGAGGHGRCSVCGLHEDNTKDRTTFLFIYRYIQIKMCNITHECVESVEKQQQQKKHGNKSYCFPSPWSSSLGLSCWTYWPRFQWHDSLTLDQNRQALACPLSSSHLWRIDFFCLTRYSSVYIMLSVCFPLCCEPRIISFFLPKFLRKKRHMSYCCSGCGGLNMYNTSRHDHFLWHKPLKMAPYFLKPIDLPSKSVCICPEITCTLNPGTLQST